MAYKVAIQGIEGSFHDIAARAFLGNEIEVNPARTFSELLNLVARERKAEVGVMAIENTISGSLLGNYSLLMSHDLHIIGEVYLRVCQNLIVLPGADLSAIREVHSHPIAIAQCREYFDQYPKIKLIEREDTAESVRYVAEKNDMGLAAIGSRRAAEIFGLKILGEEIETDKKNYTRFWVIKNGLLPSEDGEKVSLSFTVSHDVGSLHKVLSIIAFHHANLTKIQSVPQIGKPWEYLFFTDLVMINGNFKYIIEGIRPFTHSLRVIGKYKTGKMYEG